MNVSIQPLDLTSEAFYAKALDRMRWSMLVIWALATLSVGVLYGWQSGVGLLAGCGVGYLNFFWLKRMVTAVAERVTNTGRTQSGPGVVIRFLLRYMSVALFAYVILSVSPASLYGFFAGLFLPVAAIACEAAYQAYNTLIKGT